MAEKFIVLYPEALPDNTDETAALEQQILGNNVTILRRKVETFSDIPEDVCQTVNGLMILRLIVTGQDIARFPNLKAIVRMGVGTDNVDIVAAQKRQVTVHNVPHYGTRTVAHHAITLMMSLIRNLPNYFDTLRTSPDLAKAWVARFARDPSEMTLGVVGLGRIGSTVAQFAAALGFKLAFYDPYVEAGEISLKIRKIDSLEELLNISDVLSLHVPLTELTRGIIGAKQLASLPKNAFVINTSRGEVIQIEALYHSLVEGHLSAVGIDVLPEEPTLEPQSSLMKAYRARDPAVAGRIIITPHSAWLSDTSLLNIHTMSAEIMLAALTGKPVNVVQPGGY